MLVAAKAQVGILDTADAVLGTIAVSAHHVVRRREQGTDRAGEASVEADATERLDLSQGRYQRACCRASRATQSPHIVQDVVYTTVVAMWRTGSRALATDS